MSNLANLISDISDREMARRLSAAIEIAGKAGEVLLRHWKTKLDCEYKSEELDPVTIADKESDHLVRNEITRLFPLDFILSEEHEHLPEHYHGGVWMVDPLDDTKAFMKQLDSFSVSIGYVQNGAPTMGVVFAPARQIMYFGIKGFGSFLKNGDVICRLQKNGQLSLVRSRIIKKLPSTIRPLDEKVENIAWAGHFPNGSIAHRISRVAAGDAECTICTNPRTSKWDTAAGQAIIEEVGGVVTDRNGAPLDYKQEKNEWPRAVVVSANPAVHREFIDALK